MNYEIVLGCSAYALQCSVNGYISQGWEPIGGVSVINDYVNGGAQFYQAIRKTQESEES